MLFQLYILINPGSLFDYPYIAIDSESKKVIGICKEYVEILDRENASLYNPGDFIPTSRSVECPMEIIDSLVHGYIGEKQYTLLLRFTQDNHARGSMQSDFAHFTLVLTLLAFSIISGKEKLGFFFNVIMK